MIHSDDDGSDAFLSRQAGGVQATNSQSTRLAASRFAFGPVFHIKPRNRFSRRSSHGNSKVKVLGKKIRRGERMTKNSKWTLTPVSGRKRAFTGTLLETFNIGTTRIAILNVKKQKPKP
jgi:hypothetical protein